LVKNEQQGKTGESKKKESSVGDESVAADLRERKHQRRTGDYGDENPAQKERKGGHTEIKCTSPFKSTHLGDSQGAREFN